MLATVIFAGLSIGCVYGLVGFCFVSIYNASGVVNFAQGSLVMLGGIVAYGLLTHLKLPLAIGLPGVLVAVTFAAILLERGMAVPLLKRGASHIALAIGTFAVLMIYEGIAGTATGYNYLRVNPVLGYTSWALPGLRVDPQNVIIILTTATIVLIYWLMIKKTRFGLAFVATGYNRMGAALVGIQTSRMITYAFIISGAVSAIAGFLVSPLVGAQAEMGLPLAIKGFIAAVMGGMGNPIAVMSGGLILGLIASVVTGYLSSGEAEIATYIVFFIFLVLRPQGLFGTKSI